VVLDRLVVQRIFLVAQAALLVALLCPFLLLFLSPITAQSAVAVAVAVVEQHLSWQAIKVSSLFTAVVAVVAGEPAQQTVLVVVLEAQAAAQQLKVAQPAVPEHCLLLEAVATVVTAY
jgi:hypothetical protein